MTTSINRTQLLGEAHRASRFGSKASLQAANVPTNQHNVGTETKKAAAKTKSTTTPAKKTASKQAKAKKSAAKKSTTKKS